MVQNLDLDLSTSVTLNSTTSDLTAGRTWTPQNSTQTTTGTVWADDGGNVARSFDPGNIYFPNGVGTGTPDSYDNLQGTTSGEPWEFIGNYYNWYAATAGSGTSTTSSGDASDSICPKGWRLPKSSGTGSSQNLFNTYNITDDADGGAKVLMPPINYVRNGYYSIASHGSGVGIYASGRRGLFWTSTVNSSTHTYNIEVNENSVSLVESRRGWGFGVRCIAR